ncbi:hypothetical protein KIW84_076976 [Lathyrus oleraceus]|uniref:Uncharacterized protein n=1 Tax=Pisum sativum TaxID=3888 RepID=A0A9D5A046_PEA|nr:hypothetical protein KIW84_076976 [Pisum sativum]
MDVSDYFTKMNVLWDELENYRHIPHYRCSIKCSANGITSLQILLLHGYPLRGTNCAYTHCGITNHTIETCFVKHGYPQGFKNKGKTPQPSASDVSKANNDSSVIGSSNSKTFSFTQD